MVSKETNPKLFCGIIVVTIEACEDGIELDELIAEMVRRIRDKFDPVKVILFGSHARGEAREDSDVDLLVILSSVESNRMDAIRIRRLLADMPVSKDIVVSTPDELAARGDLVGSVLRPAIREGKVMYERG